KAPHKSTTMPSRNAPVRRPGPKTTIFTAFLPRACWPTLRRHETARTRMIAHLYDYDWENWPVFRAAGRTDEALAATAGEKMYPPDVDLQSGCRLPLPKREELGPDARLVYDSLADP